MWSPEFLGRKSRVFPDGSHNRKPKDHSKILTPQIARWEDPPVCVANVMTPRIVMEPRSIPRTRYHRNLLGSLATRQWFGRSDGVQTKHEFKSFFQHFSFGMRRCLTTTCDPNMGIRLKRRLPLITNPTTKVVQWFLRC